MLFPALVSGLLAQEDDPRVTLAVDAENRLVAETPGLWLQAPADANGADGGIALPALSFNGQVGTTGNGAPNAFVSEWRDPDGGSGIAIGSTPPERGARARNAVSAVMMRHGK